MLSKKAWLYSIAFSFLNFKKHLERIVLILKLKLFNNFYYERVDLDYNTSRKNLMSKREKPVNTYDTINNYSKKIDLSIIIPVYNAENFIRECIDSILFQTTHYKYELICINDGSTDSSYNILQSYKNNKINLINQNNKGSSRARNSGLNIANGKYILFVDADDFLEDNSIELLLNEAYSTDADIIQGRVCKCMIDSTTFFISPRRNITTNDHFEYYHSLGTAWGKLYKSSLWENIRFFEGYAYEDTIISLNVYPMCKKMVFLNKIIYHFRSTDNSLYKQQTNSNKAIDAIWVVEESLELAKILDIQIDYIYYQIILRHLSNVLLNRIKCLNSEEVIQSAFVVACESIDNYRNKLTTEYPNTGFCGKNKSIYKRLDNSFKQRDYGTWKLCSKILECSGAI